MARPTSPWVKPSLIRLCLKVLANCSNSSRSVVSSGDGSSLGGGCFTAGGVPGGAAISVALNYDRLGLRFLVRPAASGELAVVALPAPLPAVPDDTRLNFSSFFSYIDARCVRTNYTFKNFVSFIWFFFFFNGLSYLHGLWARMTGSWGVATALQQPLQDVDDHWSNM